MPRLRRDDALRKGTVLVALLLLAAALTSIAVFADLPRHGTETLLAVLDHLESPGLLSRDLAVMHADLSMTAFDEATLTIHRLCRMNLQTALFLQAGLCCFGASLGCYLLIRPCLDSSSIRLAVTALAMAAGLLWFGPAPFGLGGEAVPGAFAFGCTILAAGLLADAKPLLAGLAGGMALLYDFRMAVPFWLLVFVVFAADKGLRSLLKPLLWIFTVFGLLLANLAQLQPSPVAEQTWLRQMTWKIVRIDQYRSPASWLKTWSGWDFATASLVLLTISAAGVVLWDRLNRRSKWVLAGLPIVSLLSLPLTGLLMDQYRVSAFVGWELVSWLAYATILSCALSGAAMAISLQRKQIGRACSAGVLLTVLLLSGHRRSTKEPDGTSIPVSEIATLSTWAKDTTWGGSVFLFPDAGRDSYPARFRASARRALWVDWSSGILCDKSQTFADEWWRRWQDTMAQPAGPNRIRSLVTLPIDYYVLKRPNQVPGINPVFQTANLVVYDADDLRATITPERRSELSGPIRPAS